MIEKIYADATYIARERKQTVGEKNDFYITLEQLEFILKGFSGARQFLTIEQRHRLHRDTKEDK